MTEVDQYQGMSKAVVSKLLTMAAGFDRKFVPGEVDVVAFHDVAQAHRWTYHEAEQAIRFYGANLAHKEFFSAALLNALIRTTRNDHLSRQAGLVAGPGDDAAIDGTGHPVGDDPAWGTRNSAELEQVHAEALVVACPQCHQVINSRCINTRTGNASKIPHPGRMKAAGMGSPSRKINREMVLKHPDLVAELRKPPCSFTSPETWGGYLPPDRDQYGARNSSPFRAQLDRIIAEARRREEAK
jgi:hypothetical protein